MNEQNKRLVLANTVTLILMLIANFAASSGILSSVTVGDISHKYDTLFAPAGYAFIIWSVIFLLTIGFVVYQWRLLKNGDEKHYINRTGYWFALSNIANTLWLYCWINEMLTLSVILILVLLASLCVLTVRLGLELNDEPVFTILFVWWPITFYLGWMMVATIACISAWLVAIGWRGGAPGETIWTIIMIAVSTIIYFWLVIKRNLREAAAVGIWAFIAIAVRQWKLHSDIATVAIIAALILLIVTGIHGYKNRYYSPFSKIKRGELK